MEGVEISIPPVKEYRTHLTLVTRYCSAAILLTKVEDIKSLGYEQLIDEKKLISLAEKIEAADAETKIEVSLEEILMVYTCFDFMNKLLVSEYDEVVTNSPPLSLQPTDFKKLRDRSLYANTYLMQDTLEKFAEFDELFARRDLLAT